MADPRPHKWVIDLFIEDVSDEQIKAINKIFPVGKEIKAVARKEYLDEQIPEEEEEEQSWLRKKMNLRYLVSLLRRCRR